VNIFHYNLV